MTRNVKFFVLGLVAVSIISIGVNIFVIERYGLLSRPQNKVVGVSKSPAKSPPASSSMERNKPIVFRFAKNVVKRISPSFERAGKNLPNQLLIQPGVYDFSDKSYTLNKEGLYRFLLPGRENAQRIVYEKDLDLLLSAISWIVSHGNLDNKKSNAELTHKALCSKLLITCGKISGWTHYLLNNLNIRSRLVAGMTLDHWNSYNNGHSLIEVWRNKWNKWVLYDLDNNSYFIPGNGDVPLSLVEFSQAVINNDYRIIHLSSDTRLDVSNFNTADGYSYTFFSEAMNGNIRKWYRRVMQVPLIFDQSDGKYLFMDVKNRNRVESYSSVYKYIDKTDFMSRFYGSAH